MAVGQQVVWLGPWILTWQAAFRVLDLAARFLTLCLVSVYAL